VWDGTGMASLYALRRGETVAPCAGGRAGRKRAADVAEAAEARRRLSEITWRNASVAKKRREIRRKERKAKEHAHSSSRGEEEEEEERQRGEMCNVSLDVMAEGDGRAISSVI